MTSFNKLENIKHLSDHNEILKNLQKFVIDFGYDVSNYTIDLNKCTSIITLLTMDWKTISEMDLKIAYHYNGILTEYFPNYVNKYFLRCLKNDGDMAFKWIKNYMQSNKTNIIDAVDDFMKIAEFGYDYDRKCIMYHILSLKSYGPYSLFDFETNDEYEQLLIKSCKVRSVQRKWSNQFNESCADLVISVLNSNFPELIINMSFKNDMLQLFKLLQTQDKQQILDKQAHVLELFKTMNSDDKKELLQKMINNV